VKKSLFACFLTFYTLAAVAQAGHSPKIVHIKEKSAIHVPPQEAPAGLKKIYNNLGKSKTDLYEDTQGWGIFGPNSGGCCIDFAGMPFTPKSDSYVSQVQVAVQYFSGANQVNLSIYSDSYGAPGTLLAGPVTVTNLPEAGTCCTLAVASFTPLAVTGGTQYWVIVNTPLTGTGSDFSGVWVDVVKPVIPVAEYSSEVGWTGLNADWLMAAEVLGTIP
jgi:hypothetical protein